MAALTTFYDNIWAEKVITTILLLVVPSCPLYVNAFGRSINKALYYTIVTASFI